MRFVEVDHAGFHSGVEGVMLPGPGFGFRDEHDFVAAKLDGEIIALNAFRAVRQTVAVHKDIFALGNETRLAINPLPVPECVEHKQRAMEKTLKHSYVL